MEHEREREGRITDEQKITLIEFMEEHSDFARGKFTGNEGRKKLYSLWEILATRLNSLEGPRKSTAKWKRVWIDLRNKTKRKASEVKALRLRTGGGPPADITLSEIDDRIISIMSEEAVYGLTVTDGTVLDSDEVLPCSTSLSRPVASMNSTTPVPSTSSASPVASTSCVNSMGLEHLAPSPSSATDHIEIFESDESLGTSESEVEGNDDGFQPTSKRKKKTTSMDAFQKCVENSECLNNKMDRLMNIMHALVEEKKKQTALMEEMLKLKKKKYKSLTI